MNAKRIKTKRIFVDNGAGYIWGDVTRPLTPANAARALDESLNLNSTDAVTYAFLSYNPLDAIVDGYHVYEVPGDFPTVEDGQGPSAIEAVEAHTYEGFVVLHRALSE